MGKYSDLLKDPRWQKKRLKIMERDGFKCQGCGNEEKTLHVHHLKYNGMPWEAPDNHLITLCENCHEAEGQAKDNILDFIIDLNLKRGILYVDIFDTLYAIRLHLENNPGHDRKDIMSKIVKCFKNG